MPTTAARSPPSSHHMKPMPLTTSLFCAFVLALTSHARPETRESHPHSQFLDTCHKIAADISGASQVFFPRAPLIPSPVVLPT